MKYLMKYCLEIKNLQQKKISPFLDLWFDCCHGRKKTLVRNLCGMVNSGSYSMYIVQCTLHTHTEAGMKTTTVIPTAHRLLIVNNNLNVIIG